jgi:hypothetical protein
LMFRHNNSQKITRFEMQNSTQKLTIKDIVDSFWRFHWWSKPARMGSTIFFVKPKSDSSSLALPKN